MPVLIIHTVNFTPKENKKPHWLFANAVFFYPFKPGFTGIKIRALLCDPCIIASDGWCICGYLYRCDTTQNGLNAASIRGGIVHRFLAKSVN